MKSILKSYRQSPRKVRLVADAIRGKQVDKALTTLGALNKRAAHAVAKVVSSAIANAVHNDAKDRENLIIKEIAVDEGATMKRYRPRAFGRAYRIRKRTSHIAVSLGEKVVVEKAERKVKETAEKTKVKTEKKDEKSTK